VEKAIKYVPMDLRTQMIGAVETNKTPVAAV
jgi:hypothetical protein